VPARAVTGEKASLTPQLAEKAIAAGRIPNPNYKGEITDFDLNNMDVPDSENCAVRINGIHPGAKTKEIFAVIKTGKVFQFNLVSADHEHDKAAPDVTFLTHSAAEKFIVFVPWRRSRSGMLTAIRNNAASDPNSGFEITRSEPFITAMEPERREEFIIRNLVL